MGFEPEQQISDITEYTIRKNYKRFAALLPNSKYGKRVLNTYRKVLNKNKFLLNKVELYDLGTNDFEKYIQKLVGLDKNPQLEKDEETGENPIEDFDPGFDVLLLIICFVSFVAGQLLKNLSNKDKVERLSICPRSLVPKVFQGLVPTVPLNLL